MARLGILLAVVVIAGCSREFPVDEPVAAYPETDLVIPPVASLQDGTAATALPGEGPRGGIADVVKDASGKCQVTILLENSADRHFSVEVHRHGDGQLLAREEFTGNQDDHLKKWVTFEHSGALRDLRIQLMTEPDGTVLDHWGN